MFLLLIFSSLCLLILRKGYSTVIKAGDDIPKNSSYKIEGLNKALKLNNVDIRIFGKLKAWPGRRLGVILSSDKDFVQLQKYPNVAQYSPIQKKYIRNDNPQQFIKELIMRGDRSDGVPNFLSKDDTFMNGGRQRPLIKRRINEWLGMKPEEFCTEEMLRNYKRNEELIDLDFVPESLEQQILEEYEKPINGDRGKLMPYFIDKQLKNLMENIGDF